MFWDVTPGSMVIICRCFDEACYLKLRSNPRVF